MCEPAAGFSCGSAFAPNAIRELFLFAKPSIKNSHKNIYELLNTKWKNLAAITTFLLEVVIHN
jgi:hypothetical protein